MSADPLQTESVSAEPAVRAPHDPDAVFRTDHVRGDLKGKSVRGGSLVIMSQAAQFVMGAASMMYLARALGPEPFGILAMAGTLTSFVFAFREFGFGMSLIQAERVTHRQASHLFWLNLKLQVLIGLGMAAASLGLAWFYRSPALVGIVIALAVGIFVNGAMNLHRALLRRQMRFGAITAIDLAAQSLGIAAAVVGTMRGWGYWALVAQQSAIYATESIGFAAMTRWVPTSHGERAGRGDETIGRMLGYSRQYTWARIIEWAGASVDQVFIGRFAGETVLGLYSKAFQWSVLPVKQVYTPLQHVVVAGASRLLSEPDKYRAFMRNGLLATYSVVLPTLALLGVIGRDFILVLLSDRWSDAIPMFRVLVLGAFVGSAGQLTRWVYLSEGRSRPQLQWTQVQTPILIAAVAVGIYWGAIGVAWAIAICTVLLTVPNVQHCLKGSPLRARDFWGAGVRPAALSLAAAAVVYAADHYALYAWPIAARLAVSVPLFGAVYFAGWWVIPGGPRDFRALWDMLLTIAGRGKAKG